MPACCVGRHGDAHGCAHPHAYQSANFGADQHWHADPRADLHAYCHADVDAYTASHVDAHPDAHLHADRDQRPNHDPQPHANGRLSRRG